MIISQFDTSNQVTTIGGKRLVSNKNFAFNKNVVNFSSIGDGGIGPLCAETTTQKKCAETTTQKKTGLTGNPKVKYFRNVWNVWNVRNVWNVWNVRNVWNVWNVKTKKRNTKFSKLWKIILRIL